MVKPSLKKILFGLAVIALVITSSIFSYSLGQDAAKKKIVNDFFTQGSPENAKNLDFTLFWDTWQALKDKFIDQSKFDQQKMLYGAVSGMVRSLGDPYTIFLDPQDSQKFLEDVSGKFEGVGMEIGLKNGQLQVIAPLPGTPAQRAGIRAGDKIAKIDGVLTTDMTVDEAVNRIRGKKGTEVKLTLFREGWSDTKEFQLTREVIQVPSVKWEMKQDRLAYLQLYQFSAQADFDFPRAAEEMKRAGAQKIVLDLRNNPGGYLEVAKDIAGFFLDKGSLVAIEDFGGKQEAKKYIAPGPGYFSQTPVVVLINQGSASAAEILAGALRDDRQIKLVGETSFGKGSVQELETLTGGSTLKVTVAKWLTPSGQSISEHGLTPDVTVSISDEDYKQEKDPQRDKAIEIIQKIP